MLQEKSKIEALSNYELYLLVRKCIVYEYFKKKPYKNRNLIMDTATERDKRIVSFALKDAMLTINSVRFGMRELFVADIKRIDLMTAEEINELIQKIGASRRQPVVSDELVEKRTLLDIVGISSENLIICSVDGASMTGVIEPGDIIFVDTAEKPANNKIVVVNIDGNLLVKRFVQENGSVWLYSDNPAFEPIKVSEGYTFEIFGVVKRIMRSV